MSHCRIYRDYASWKKLQKGECKMEENWIWSGDFKLKFGNQCIFDRFTEDTISRFFIIL
jgi:hypothetical protein